MFLRQIFAKLGWLDRISKNDLVIWPRTTSFLLILASFEKNLKTTTLFLNIDKLYVHTETLDFDGGSD
jgi:hypothetical protein